MTMTDRDVFMDVEFFDRWIDETDPTVVSNVLHGVQDYIAELEAIDG